MYNTLDWGNTNMVASAYENEVYVSRIDSTMPFLVTNTDLSVGNCVKWNRAGTQFAFSLIRCGINIWDNESMKVI